MEFKTLYFHDGWELLKRLGTLIVAIMVIEVISLYSLPLLKLYGYALDGSAVSAIKSCLWLLHFLLSVFLAYDGYCLLLYPDSSRAKDGRLFWGYVGQALIVLLMLLVCYAGVIVGVAMLWSVEDATAQFGQLNLMGFDGFLVTTVIGVVTMTLVSFFSTLLPAFLAGVRKGVKPTLARVRGQLPYIFVRIVPLQILTSVFMLLGTLHFGTLISTGPLRAGTAMPDIPGLVLALAASLYALLYTLCACVIVARAFMRAEFEGHNDQPLAVPYLGQAPIAKQLELMKEKELLAAGKMEAKGQN